MHMAINQKCRTHFNQRLLLGRKSAHLLNSLKVSCLPVLLSLHQSIKAAKVITTWAAKVIMTRAPKVITTRPAKVITTRVAKVITTRAAKVITTRAAKVITTRAAKVITTRHPRSLRPGQPRSLRPGQPRSLRPGQPRSLRPGTQGHYNQGTQGHYDQAPKIITTRSAKVKVMRPEHPLMVISTRRMKVTKLHHTGRYPLRRILPTDWLRSCRVQSSGV